jgi:hypothetical protein
MTSDSNPPQEDTAMLINAISKFLIFIFCLFLNCLTIEQFCLELAHNVLVLGFKRAKRLIRFAR